MRHKIKTERRQRRQWWARESDRQTGGQRGSKHKAASQRGISGRRDPSRVLRRRCRVEVQGAAGSKALVGNELSALPGQGQALLAGVE